MLELASSPGRVVGDARGRWGVGAVPDADATGVPTQLSAALHVFAAVPLPTVAAPSGLGGGEPTKPPVASVLVESPAGSAGVMQMLSVGGSRSRPSVPELSPAPDNTIVLSSRQPGNRTGFSLFAYGGAGERGLVNGFNIGKHFLFFPKSRQRRGSVRHM